MTTGAHTDNYQEIVARFLSGHQGAKAKGCPVLCCTGGGPGSGKNTFGIILQSHGILPEDMAIFDAGLFGHLPEATSIDHPHPEKTPAMIREYHAARRACMDAALSRGISVIVNDHFDDRKEQELLIQKAKEAGYLTALFLFTRSPEDYFEYMNMQAAASSIDPKPFYPWALGIYKDLMERAESLAPQFDVFALIERSFTSDIPFRNVVICETSQRGSTTILYDGEQYEALTKKWQSVEQGFQNAAEAKAAFEAANAGHPSGNHRENLFSRTFDPTAKQRLEHSPIIDKFMQRFADNSASGDITP